MSDEIRHDKKVTVELEQAFNTNGYYHGHVDGDPKKPFIGRTTVDPVLAEDLERRKQAYEEYDRSRNRNNGRPIPSGNLVGGSSS